VSDVADQKNDAAKNDAAKTNSAETKAGEKNVPGSEIGAAHSSAQMSEADHEEHLARGGLVAGRQRKGMFNVKGSGDTSGFGGLRLPAYAPAPAERPYGGWFDEVTDELAVALGEAGVPADAVQQITIDRGEITFYLRREHLLDVCRVLRDDPALRFELCSSVSGVDYGVDVAQRLHSVYHLTSMTYRRRIRLEVAVDVDDAHVPSVVSVYPTADWQEREAWDMFGNVYDGHPGLTRILMPDDWDGHPQRKDYPLGGIPVEYKGAEIPPPDQRRSYS
jgi:NADH-quinone oxidoreductase subunit C